MFQNSARLPYIVRNLKLQKDYFEQYTGPNTKVYKEKTHCTSLQIKVHRYPICQ